jgi:hypothetical protein
MTNGAQPLPNEKAMKPRILFVCKRADAGNSYSTHRASGLRNSVRFMLGMLLHLEIPASMVEVNDNNDIDREVHHFRPTHVIVEALWVVPEKFAELRHHHPHVNWIVRIHSELPFLAMEGVALDWLAGYRNQPHVTIAANSDRMYRDLGQLFGYEGIGYLPNYYPLPARGPNSPSNDGWVDVGCFGAVRPLKNHLVQAVAAIAFARELGRPLAFHINGSRTEQRGDNVLKNLRGLFANTDDAMLVEWPWLSHYQFAREVQKMHLGLQVSFSETFNIVSADLVAGGVPVVTSPEVRWVPKLFQAEPTSVPEIVDAMRWAWRLRRGVAQTMNRRALGRYNEDSVKAWARYFDVKAC